MSEAVVFSRVLVALDASPHSLTALEAAVELAALFGAELLGIFVEDADLLRLADLSFASEVASFSASIQRLDAERMRLQLRAVAERSRRALAVSAERAHVRWSFRVARGSVAASVMEGVGGRDLISFGRLGWSRLGKPLGSTARAILSEARASTLVLQRGRRIGAPLCALYDGSKAARHGLDAIARLARGSTPTVLIVASDDGVAERLEREAQEFLQAQGITARLLRVRESNREAIRAAIRAQGAGLIVVPIDGALASSEDVIDLLMELDAPILLVRDGE
ncbi:MAG TPA: universal stress protein [Candidatus Binatia bacterium]|nr:universal stress protein [Candidatus Binatia bacterium]